MRKLRNIFKNEWRYDRPKPIKPSHIDNALEPSHAVSINITPQYSNQAYEATKKANRLGWGFGGEPEVKKKKQIDALRSLKK